MIHQFPNADVLSGGHWRQLGGRGRRYEARPPRGLEGFEHGLGRGQELGSRHRLGLGRSGIGCRTRRCRWEKGGTSQAGVFERQSFQGRLGVETESSSQRFGHLEEKQIRPPPGVLEFQAVFIQTPNGRLTEGSAIQGDDVFGRQHRQQRGLGDE